MIPLGKGVFDSYVASGAENGFERAFLSSTFYCG